jgi:hypothetical protein
LLDIFSSFVARHVQYFLPAPGPRKSLARATGRRVRRHIGSRARAGWANLDEKPQKNGRI